MSKRKVAIYGALSLVGIIAFWLGFYIWFKNSSDWVLIQEKISESDAIRSSVGEVVDISLPIFGFSYRSVGSWAAADLHVYVEGESGSNEFRVKLERRDWKWSIVAISKLRQSRESRGQSAVKGSECLKSPTCSQGVRVLEITNMV